MIGMMSPSLSAPEHVCHLKQKWLSIDNHFVLFDVLPMWTIDMMSPLLSTPCCQHHGITATISVVTGGP